jgi:hypothetical protein
MVDAGTLIVMTAAMGGTSFGFVGAVICNRLLRR